jgi:hypothetical protein
MVFAAFTVYDYRIAKKDKIVPETTQIKAKKQKTPKY